MADMNSEIMKLITRYKDNTKQALMENPKLEYLYALSEIRENVLEWFPFKKDAVLLQVGSDFGALTGLYARSVSQVVVLDDSAENLEINRLRHKAAGNIRYVNGSLHYYQARLEIQADNAIEDEEIIPDHFDYIVFLGTLTPPYDSYIAAAKYLLKESGQLIVAACNPLGIKYWAGAKADEHSITLSHLKGLLTGDDGMEGKLDCYYPVPDYKLPTAVYSQDYLPAKGDLTEAVLAYDYPEYLWVDVGAAYDLVCGDGQFENFANSFLMIWRKYDAN